MRISANGVNAVKGILGMPYLLRTLTQTLSESRGERGQPLAAPVVVLNRYNPTLEYRFYMIPALMIMLLIVQCGFLPALDLSGERRPARSNRSTLRPSAA